MPEDTGMFTIYGFKLKDLNDLNVKKIGASLIGITVVGGTYPITLETFRRMFNL